MQRITGYIAIGAVLGFILAATMPNKLRHETPYKAATALCADNGGIGTITLRLFARDALECRNGAKFDLTRAVRSRKYK